MANKGLTAQERRLILAEELGDGDGELSDPVPPDPPPAPGPVPSAPPPVPPPDPPAATALAPELGALIQALVTGIQQGNAGTAAAIKAALGEAAAMARDPIPENSIAPGLGVYAHPDGDQKTPRTALRCPMFLGVYDDEGKVDPAFEIYPDTCSEWERVQLNLLQPGIYPQIERNDGVRASWRVVQKSDDHGTPIRLVIGVPQGWLAQDQFQQMPSQRSFLRQLNDPALAASV